MQDAAGMEAERAAKMQSILRLNLGIRDGSANVYWKHDGERFTTKSKVNLKPGDWRCLCSGSTLKLCSGSTYQLTFTSSRPVKIRPSSGRWDLKEVDVDGREVPPQFQVLLPTSQPQSYSQPHLQPPPTAPLQSAPPSQFQPFPFQPQPRPLFPSPGGWPASAASSGGGDLSAIDPRVIRWVDETTDASRTTYTAELPCNLPPTEAGRRQYLLIEAYVEDFGLVVCPLQIKVYKPRDKNALSSFPLRFVQFDFREDSSSVGDLFAVNFYRY